MSKREFTVCLGPKHYENLDPFNDARTSLKMSRDTKIDKTFVTKAAVSLRELISVSYIFRQSIAVAHDLYFTQCFS